MLIRVLQIGTADGSLTRSDLLTRLYMLAAIYSDSADRRRLVREQGFTDFKAMLSDINIRLQGNFTLTKEQLVRGQWFVYGSITISNSHFCRPIFEKPLTI
jgi:hypothetical protein